MLRCDLRVSKEFAPRRGRVGGESEVILDKTETVWKHSPRGSPADIYKFMGIPDAFTQFGQDCSLLLPFSGFANCVDYFISTDSLIETCHIKGGATRTRQSRNDCVSITLSAFDDDILGL
jgi:hypothetical protein